MRPVLSVHLLGPASNGSLASWGNIESMRVSWPVVKALRARKAPSLTAQHEARPVSSKPLDGWTIAEPVDPQLCTCVHHSDTSTAA